MADKKNKDKNENKLNGQPEELDREEQTAAGEDSVQEEKPGKKPREKKKFNSKKLKHGAMATAFTCVFIAVVVLVNVVATMIFDRYPITFDLTENKMYSVSEDSEKYVKKINTDVYVTILATEEEFRNIQYGSDYTRQAAELLTRYSQYNPKIHVKYVDYLSNPEVLNDYTDTQTLEQFDMIFETRPTDSEGNEFKRLSIVKPMDLVNISEEMEQSINSYYQNKETFIEYMGGSYMAFLQCAYYGVLESSNVESAFTSALMTVADDDPVKVTFLVADRKEAELDHFKSLLEANAYVVDEINISTQDIPEDTNIIVVPAPKVDYTSDEITKIDKFLDNDGRLDKHMLYISSVEQAETPNLDEFLEEYGLQVQRRVIGELDAQYYYAGNQYNTVQYIVGESYLDNFEKDNATIYAPFSRVVKTLFDEDGMKRTEAYLSSSPNASAVSIDDSQDVEQSGALYSMAFGSKVRFADEQDEDQENHYSHIIAFGTEQFFADEYLSAPQFRNSDLIISLFNGIVNKNPGVIITPKTVGAVTFDINEKQANILKYAYVFIIPAAILVLGLVIYIRRKNK